MIIRSEQDLSIPSPEAFKFFCFFLTEVDLILFIT